MKEGERVKEGERKTQREGGREKESASLLYAIRRVNLDTDSDRQI